MTYHHQAARPGLARGDLQSHPHFQRDRSTTFSTNCCRTPAVLARRTIAMSALHLDDACVITVSDDGAGIDDPANLVSLGQSDWSDECRAREDPAGHGLLQPGRARHRGQFGQRHSVVLAGDYRTGLDR